MRRWRAWRVVAAVLLVGLLGAALPGPGDNPSDKPADTPPADSASANPPAGDLLVASAQITDPRFSHTVILILKHDAGGALGIVINRPLEEKSIAGLLGAAKDAKPGPRGDDTGVEGTIRVFAGGPVQRALGFIVHTPDYKRDATVVAGPLVSMTPTTETLRDIGHHKGPAKYFFALGYAGWGPGQLEAEISHHDWFSTPGDATLIFDEDRGELWKHALERRTHDL